MSNKYPKILEIPKALESYISLTERLKIQQMNSWSRIVENMQNSIPKFDSTNISGTFSTMTTISDIIRQHSINSSFNSAFQNSSITKLQEIIHTQNLYLERIIENESFIFNNYVSDEISQMTDDLVMELKDTADSGEFDTSSLPTKESKWTEGQVWQIITIVITVVLAIAQMCQSEIHQQENSEQQRLETEQLIQLEQKKIQSINELTVRIEQLTQALTNESDMTTDSTELKQQNPKNDYK